MSRLENELILAVRPPSHLYRLAGPFMRFLITGCIVSIGCLGILISQPSLASGAPQDARKPNVLQSDSTRLEKRVRDLFAGKCLECHGTDAQESHLRLDRRRSMLEGGDSGEPAIVVGDGAHSHLIALVQGKEAGRIMPPEESNRLSKEEIEVLIAWIDAGAPWHSPDSEDQKDPPLPNHWAFQPLQSPEPPSIASPFIANPIDSFILERLNEQGIAPSPVASKRMLIRRLYLDMLGVPPTPEEILSFEQDHSLEAYSNLVERVLQNPHYGERWGQHWLDLVRFAETNGFETNRERPNAWPYRDYVIRAWNADKSFFQFVREQIAGDALGVPEATGYLVAGPYDLVKSPDPSLTLMQRQNELDDMVGTTGTVFLGLTVGCARCHNHKFDPIRQTDYYAMQSIFAGVQHGERKLSFSESTLQSLAHIDERLAELRESLAPFLKDPYRFRPPVNAARNTESFPSVEARFLRFVVEDTNSGEPCIDELEVFSKEKNVALSSEGCIATASSSLPNYEIHQLKHIHDGRGGNSASWISNEPGKGWVQLEFPGAMRIDRVVWARDRDGRFSDRLATRYRIEIAETLGNWKQIASSEDRMPPSDAAWTSRYDFGRQAEIDAQRGRSLLDESLELEQRRQQLIASRTVYAGVFEQPAPSHRLFRGEPTSPRERVAPGTIAALGSLAIDDTTPEQFRRLALADWIASPDNPLTSRVIVNRVWQYHFGKGLVETPNDFGEAGIAPTHPELLDYLARYLVNNDGSLKQLHRLILHSSTYRQSSESRAESMQRDGGTQWWWRFPPRRLEAEAIRDGILAVTDSLDRRMHGPGFSGFEVELENVRHYFPKQKYSSEDWRRMVYMTKVRMERESVFGAFDCPDSSISVPKRNRSTTPMQALNLFNSPFVLQQAQLLANRLNKECGSDLGSQVERGYWLCMGRPPLPDELQDALSFIDAEGIVPFCRVLLNSNEFVFLP
ncbi:PSD1 and planctomycete cytochrome C domain-containing protein [Pirellula sp. SH-Sr6A]|uniref:PSD1 and planctomycete cytochrome C domain-containing protein n=1 Tax=Pirellula sp. SH-Sr6A TaxID=1632865 RepID=UPI0011BADE41|nr:PSD1 and planctomycete cytochrome C domain-containing protein [Pirellula sp. SH-Sr6A]